MFAAHIRQGQVNHFMHENPVFTKLRGGDTAADLKSNQRLRRTECGAMTHAASLRRHHSYAQLCDGETPVIAGHRVDRALDPGDKLRCAVMEIRVRKLQSNLNARALK